MKSKSLLGTISGVERSRVSELQNPDPDKQLAPHWRVLGTLIICAYVLCFFSS